MVCEANETDVRIGIPVVMLPQDAGESLKESMKNSSHGKLFHAWLKSSEDQIWRFCPHSFFYVVLMLYAILLHSSCIHVLASVCMELFPCIVINGLVVIFSFNSDVLSAATRS